jgi:hypothetical protein
MAFSPVAWLGCLVAGLVGMTLPAAALTPVGEAEARQAASAWLEQRLARFGSWDDAATAAVTTVQPVYSRTAPGCVLGYVAGVEPAGFILISPVRELPPVKAYNTTDAFDLTVADPTSFEAMASASLEASLNALVLDEEALDTSANQQAWSTFAPVAVAGPRVRMAASAVMNSAYAGTTTIPFVVRDPLMANAFYSGQYVGVPTWGDGAPFNRTCPEARTTPEEIWLDRDNSYSFTQTSSSEDLKLYFPSGNWQTPVTPPVDPKFPARQTGLYFYDVTGTGTGSYVCTFDPETFEMTSGVPIWMDQDTDPDTPGMQGSGVYNLGVDIRVYPNPNNSAWGTVSDGAIGSQHQLFYSDTDFSRGYTNLTQHTIPGYVRPFAEIMRYWEWPVQGVGSHSYQWAYHEDGKDPTVTVPLTANFEHTYSWARMPLVLAGNSDGWSTIDNNSDPLWRLCTDGELNNIGQLIYDLGVCFETDFQFEKSSMVLGQASLNRFAQHFKYNSRAISYLARQDFPDDSSWFDAFRSELDARRPVEMTAFITDGTALPFVVDGYDKTAGSANLYMLHCNYGSNHYWYALDNINGLPYALPDDAMGDVMKQSGAFNVLPQRVKPVAGAEIFRVTGDSVGDTLAAGLQDTVNVYGQSLLQLSWFPMVSDLYYPTGRTAAIAQLNARINRYSPSATPTATVVISGHAASKVQGTGSGVSDYINTLTETQRQLKNMARYRVVGDAVLGVTPTSASLLVPEPVFKSDIYVSRLDEEAPVTETVTLTLFLVENVDATHARVVRDCLYSAPIILGYGETRVVNAADFPQPPPGTWNLANCAVMALLEAADGTLLQAANLELFDPGPNFRYDYDLSSYRPRIANAAPMAPGRVDLTESDDGLSITAVPVGAYDPDGDAITYVYDWYVNGVPLVSPPYQEVDVPPVTEAYPDLGATITPADYPAWQDGDFWYCEVRVRDCWYSSVPSHKRNLHESPAVLSNMAIITSAAPAINNPPTIPTFATVTPAQPVAADSLVCLTGGATDPDGDVIAYFYEWYRNDTATGYTDAALPYGVTAAGEAWTCDVYARDLWGAVGPLLTSNAVTIVASATNRPTAPVTVSAGPADPSYTATLTCGEPVGIVCADAYEANFRWWRKAMGAWEPTDLTGRTVALSPADIGTLWRCEVYGRNSVTLAIGPSIFSNELLVRNHAPSAPSVKVTPQNARLTDDVQCVASSSEDLEEGGNVHYHYEWLLNGVFSGFEGWGPVAAVVPARYLTSGQLWSCRVYTQDSLGARSPVVDSFNSSFVGLAPTAPTSVTVKPNRPEPGDTLECVAQGAVDPDGGTVSYLYTWFRETPVPTGTTPPPNPSFLPPPSPSHFWDVAGAGATLATTVYGERWVCAVCATDGVLNSAYVGSQAVIIGNRPPTAPTLALTPAKPSVGEAITCVASGSTDPDGDAFNYSIKWYQNDLTTFYSGPVLPAGKTMLGDVWRCVVTATDVWTPAATSPATTVTISFVDSGPTVPTAVVVTPAFPRGGSALLCTASGATDANGDPVSYVFQWYRNGALVPEYTTNSVPPGVILDHEIWYCAAAASAAGQQSAFVASGTVTVGNVAPTKPTSVVINPNPAGIVEDLTCVAGGSLDPNGDAVTYHYEWLVLHPNGSSDLGPADYRVPKALLQRGDVWTCTVYATDGSLDSETVTSSPRAIENLAPTAPTMVSIIPATPTVVDDLLCVAGGSSDPEGGSVTNQYAWYRNGILTSETGQRVFAAKLGVGEKWKCAVYTEDVEGARSPVVTSDEVTIISANPSAPTVTVAPADATRNSTLVCTAEGSVDPLGGVLVYHFDWFVYRGGVWIDTGISTSSVAPANLALNDTWKCAVYTESTRGFRSPVVTSNEAVVSNHPPTPPAKALLSPPVAGIGGTITCIPSGATDADGDSVSYLFRWQNDGGTGTWVDSGDTTALITIGSGQNGWSWRCWVAASDGLLMSSEILAGNVVKVIGNAPMWSPTSSVVVTSGSGKLTVTARGITDTDPGDLANMLCLFTWYRNGMDSGLRGEGIRSGTAPNYSWTFDAPRAIMNPGESWSCTATPVDPQGVTGVAKASNSVVIANQAPPAPAAALIAPVAPTVNNALWVVVTPTTPATDPDGDTAAYVYRWYKNNTLQDSHSGPSLPVGATAVGDKWFVEVLARDAFGSVSAAARSNEVGIAAPGLDVFEWDNEAAAAQTIGNGVIQRHALPSGDVDWVRFSLDRLSSLRLTATVETTAATVTPELALFRSDNLTTPIVTVNTDLARVLSPGDYYVRVRPAGAVTSTPIYALLLQTSAIVALGSNVKPVYTLTPANNIAWGYFQVAMPASLTITRTTTLGTGTLTTALYDANQNKLSETTAAALTYSTTAGVYYVRVTGSGIATNSSLSFNLALGPSSVAPLAHKAPDDPAFVRLFPGSPVNATRLHAVPAWSGNGNETWFYWYQNGIYRPDLSGKKVTSTVITPTDPFFVGTGTYAPNDGVTSVDGAYIESGDTWHCEVVVRDNLGVASSRIVSNDVTVGAVADWSMEFDTDLANFVIGQAANATDGWDEGIDDVSVPLGLPFDPGLVFLLGPDELHTYMYKDIRGFSRNVQYWVLHVPDKTAAGSMTWDVSKLPAGASLMMVEVTGPTGTVISGTEVDMTAVSSFAFNGASQDAPWYWIVAVTGGETYERVALGEGWNLISFTLLAENDAADKVFTTGSIWSCQYDKDTNAYVYTNPTTLAPRLGYWVLSPLNQVIEHTGKPSLTGTVNLSRGWNLVGPAGTCVAPADPLLVRNAICGWSNPNVRRSAGETPDTDSAQYEVTGILKINFGYWIYVLDDVTLNLR